MAHLPFLITLSPAKKFHPIASARGAPFSSPQFLSQADVLASNLKKLSASELAKTMEISEAIADLNYQRYQDYQLNQSDTGYPACSLFAGDAFKTLDFDSLKANQQSIAQSHLVILSGLYGFLRPLDLIQPYRLEMGSRVRPYLGHDLYEFWRSQLTQSLSSYINDHAITTHINLASQEYAKVIDQSELPCPTIRITFADSHESGYRVIGIKAKRARGLMARYIMMTQPKSLKELKQFNTGYTHSKAHSSDGEIVFLSNA